MTIERAAARLHATALFAATVDAGGRATVTSRDLAGGGPLTEGTMFELASVTKTYVGFLLAELTLAGIVGLDDAVGELVPGLASAGDITLRQLVTHTSGLPSEPHDAGGRTGDEGRYTRTTEELTVAVAGATRRRPGTRRYSNLGFVLLAHALSQAAGKPFGSLMREVVLDPLGLDDTRFVDDLPAGRAVTGHRADLGTPVPPSVELSGAGGLWATGPDLLRWAGVWLSPPHERPAAGLALRERLAWRVQGAVVTHTGATKGSTSFCGFNTATRKVSVLLLDAGVSAVALRPRAIPILVDVLRLRRRLLAPLR